jgi:hypothetical protein
MEQERLYRTRAKIWLYQGAAAWHFLTIPKRHSDHIKSHFGWRLKGRKGWGSVKVQVTIGKTTWSTSIFPDSKTGCYVLPLKEAVRKTEGLKAGKMASLTLRITPL